MLLTGTSEVDPFLVDPGLRMRSHDFSIFIAPAARSEGNSVEEYVQVCGGRGGGFRQILSAKRTKKWEFLLHCSFLLLLCAHFGIENQREALIAD